MSTIDHELTFCGDAAGWMNAEIRARPELAFEQVKIEQSVRGSRCRRDLTVTDRAGKIAITGEVKLPYMPDGGSPYNDDVVADAHSKAAKVGSPYFLTWNVNRIVLWRTDDAGKPLFERHLYEEVFVQVRDAQDLIASPVREAIRKGLARFLDRASQAYTNVLPLARRPLDEFFITILEAALERPIAISQRAIEARYARDGRFKIQLDSWMRDTQQWHLSDDELVKRDNLERAAKFTCFVLVNKIVFYQALRRRFTSLSMLRVPGRLSTAAELETTLAKFFAQAKRITRDYETVFDGDFGDSLPFLSDHVVPAWRDLLKSIDRFDFTQVNYDVIGPIFERLISPEERHRYGQHYTKPEIVDLINAFCIRRPDAVVLDPACGGGTFLVRAYNRKRFLAEGDGTDLPHELLLDQLYGVDISAYATHLTTMNLATRDLIDEHNYPLIAQSDFFDIERGKEVFHIPAMAANGGAKLFRPVKIDAVDAVVGNPPYVRQEEISKPPTASAKSKVRITARTLEQIKSEATAYKNRLQASAKRVCPGISLSGRSDLHVYFWPHAKSFLKNDGWFGFLTSSSWLDVEYGFRLQEFILRTYRIVAVFESQVEPWFTGARVTTCATILQREPDPEKRDANLIRFVQLRSPLAEIFPSAALEDRRQRATEALRDRIESIRENVTERHWRVRVVRQGDLYQQGCAPSKDTTEEEDADLPASDTARRSEHGSVYRGGKWSVYLRAPDLFFQLQERFARRLVPLSELADVRFGVKTGCDKFFFVRDVTEARLKEMPDAREFRKTYGLQPIQTDRIRIVLAGDRSLHLIESEYLEPEIHSLMELSRVSIDDASLSRCAFMCSLPKSELKKTRALRYIQWGEREGFDKTVTVAARASSRAWYDITQCVRPQIVLPKIQQYRHIVSLNPTRRACNSSLISITSSFDADLLAAVLNSTLVGFMKWFHARQLGNEANLQIDVYAAKRMPIPDLRRIDARIANRLRDAFRRMQERDLPDLDEDLGAPDRLALDDAVLQLLGETAEETRQALLKELYDEVRTMHRQFKDKERLAMRNRAITARGSTLSVEQIAQQVWDELDPSLIRRFPEDFIDPDEPAEVIDLPDGKLRIVDNSLLGHVGVDIDGHYIEIGDPARANLLKRIFDCGRRGPVPIPKDPRVCETVDQRFRDYGAQIESEFADQASQKTASEKFQAKVVANLRHRLVQVGSPERVPQQ